MSHSGKLYAEMIARQKEELRQQRVREQCNDILRSVTEKLNQFANDPQFSSIFTDAHLIQKEIGQISSRIQKEPDMALEQIQAVSLKLNESVGNVIAQEQKWSEQRKISYLEILRTIESIDSLPMRSQELANKAKSLSSRLKSLSETATSSNDIQKAITEATTEIEQLRYQDEQEEIRKEIVKRVLSVLKNQGYSVSNPVLKENIVHVKGKLPSGKTVMFQIRHEGEIDFDLDGYVGQTCKNELEAILEILRTEEMIESSVEQFTWHNPDKIKKGSKEFPYGGGLQNSMKRQG
nr:hypothetical protein [uncultured Methanolobus sp.]